MTLLTKFNAAAMILGYACLSVLVVLVVFVVAKLTRELIHHHRRKKYEEDEMEHARSLWFFESYQQDRQDTDILDFPSTVEYEAVSYLKEHESNGPRKRRKPGI